MDRSKFFQELDRYFERTLADHGPSARGVDWPSAESQQLRFEQLLEIRGGRARFSLNDYGCGYGALFDHLAESGLEVDYRGFDLSERMIALARESHPGAEWVTREADLRPADLTIASGVFNLKLEVEPEEWRKYVLETLAALDRLSVMGFAFNMLTSYSDRPLMRPELYYGDPSFFFDVCKRRYSRNVALLHDYGLYEWTILVRK